MKKCKIKYDIYIEGVYSMDVAKEIQIQLLEAIKEFKKACDIENITFFLRGGSVMGAVKYQGFVPWDDDMDIAVPREEYDRMIAFFKKQPILAGKFQVLSYTYEPKLQCYFPRLFLLEEERKKLGLPSNTTLGLHLIDILPLDGAPANVIARKIYFLKVYCLRALASLETSYDGANVNMHTSKQKLVINTLKFFQLHRIFKQRRVYGMLDKLYRKIDWRTSKYAGTITASLFTKEVMPTEIWGQGVWLPFEDTLMKVPSEYDTYLKIMYGERYKEEEPEHKRSHHG